MTYKNTLLLTNIIRLFQFFRIFFYSSEERESLLKSVGNDPKRIGPFFLVAKKNGFPWFTEDSIGTEIGK